MRPIPLLTIVWLAACAPVDAPAPDTPGAVQTASPFALLVQGPVWRITHAGGMAAPPGQTATLTRKGGSIAGNSGCNQYSGRATVGATALDFSDLTGTLMACVDPRAMEYEGRVMQALDRADGVRGTPGGPLSLTAGGAEIARLVPVPPG